MEWIACHPDASGRGIGSKLLKWADSFAASKGCTHITLDVMKNNAGAVALYTRKGYAVQSKGHSGREGLADRFVTWMFVFFALGYKYWTVFHMRKELQSASVADAC